MLSEKSDVYSLGVSLVEISTIIPLPCSPRELRVKDEIAPKYAEGYKNHKLIFLTLD